MPSESAVPTRSLGAATRRGITCSVAAVSAVLIASNAVSWVSRVQRRLGGRALRALDPEERPSTSYEVGPPIAFSTSTMMRAVRVEPLLVGRAQLPPKIVSLIRKTVGRDGNFALNSLETCLSTGRKPHSAQIRCAAGVFVNRMNWFALSCSRSS